LHVGRSGPVRLKERGQSGTVSDNDAKDFMRALLDVILILLQLYTWLLIASAVLSWLIAFNVVNVRNQLVSSVGEFLYRITEPLQRPIRSFVPNFGGLDISPVLLILLIILIERIIIYYIYPNVM
jgi:YggT family protein